MLIFDFRQIGEKLFAIRKMAGLTQSEVAEAANLSDRTYADIERGSVNMRIETILKICDALHITPDVIFTENASDLSEKEKELTELYNKCTLSQQRTALELLSVYLNSLHLPK